MDGVGEDLYIGSKQKLVILFIGSKQK